ncbi:MAG: DUF1553 domain-containing protein [Gemmataceae bacterium]|nr:DUF1553 domain-containing protein [Gemmataceae bacterium]
MRIILVTLALLTGPAVLAAEVDYILQVKPIFESRCASCHGVLAQKAKLRLDHGEFIRKGSSNGPVIVPGKNGKSLLIQAVLGQDRERMPPTKEGAPLTPAQVQILKQWIDEGARTPANEPLPADPTRHWAFQKPLRPPLPAAKLSANPIDRFLGPAMESRGLTPAPRAEKTTLLRRVYLDLVGVPPEPEDLRRFLADASPDAYEKLVDRLLQDPRHGERWARHWMDIWRYSDWYGRRNVPDVWNSAPQVWRWRDWIVQSLNRDLGYDQMVREMLAADEFKPGDDKASVATGFLVRNWYALNPNDWMRNIVEHTGKAFLGLTFNCAHCHDHKYDPIRQEDYFGFRAFFEPIYVRQDRMAGEADSGPFQDYDYSVLRKIQRLGMVRVFDKTPEAPTWFYTGGDERNRVKERGSIPPHVPAMFKQPPPRIDPVELPGEVISRALKSDIRATILADAQAALTVAEKELAQAPPLSPLEEKEAAKEKELPRLRAEVARQKVEAARAALADLSARLVAEEAAYAKPQPTNLGELKRQAARLEKLALAAKAQTELQQGEVALGEAKKLPEAKLKPAVDAANKRVTQAKAELQKVQAALKDPAQAEKYSPVSRVYPAKSSGRRKALAEWITSRENPLPARVAVNHIWNWHFHAPLVASIHDFGMNGKLPTHPELLDWLAVEFMDSGWNMKALHRLIVTSNAYQRGSTSGDISKDQENLFLARMNTGRMEAEVLRDSLLHCAGKLNYTMGGQELENTEALKTFRRSLYYSCFPEGGGKGVLGELFDGPDPLDCYRRSVSIVPQQALALTNSELIHQLSSELAVKLLSESRQTGAGFIQLAYERILSRPPSKAEVEACASFLGRPGDDKTRAALVRVLFNHNDFLSIR